MIFQLIISSMYIHVMFAQGIRYIDPVIITRGTETADTCPSLEVRQESVQRIQENVASLISDVHQIAQCGDGVWYRVAYLNMSNTSQQCPSTWQEYDGSSSNGVRACGRQVSVDCDGTVYPVNHEYSKVCGRVIGYQVTSPDAFGFRPTPESVNDIYVDGVSVTYGSPRTHIWTFAAGVTEGTGNPMLTCPCALSDPSTGHPAPNFIGDNYYCESGNPSPTGDWIAGHLYSNDPLWDGQECEGQCCMRSYGMNPPWFNVDLTSSTSDAIEVRICGDQLLANEDSPIALMELYVQ